MRHNFPKNVQNHLDAVKILYWLMTVLGAVCIGVIIIAAYELSDGKTVLVGNFSIPAFVFITAGIGLAILCLNFYGNRRVSFRQKIWDAIAPSILIILAIIGYFYV